MPENRNELSQPEPFVDIVDESSAESFPASDPPIWAIGRSHPATLDVAAAADEPEHRRHPAGERNLRRPRSSEAHSPPDR